MSLSPSVQDRELNKFRDAGEKYSKVAVTMEGDTGLLEGISYDEIQATYPSSSTELYTYKLSSTTVASILVTYSNSSKKTLVSVARV